jgi:hypothetical protein
MKAEQHPAFSDEPMWRLISQHVVRPSVYLVGRAIYNDTDPQIDMAQMGSDGVWLNMQGSQLSFVPNWFADAPVYPPWPPEGVV